jgi:hypothetical protein
VETTMKAKTISSFFQILALVALTGVLAPRVATAQQDESGKFTLPAEVHWGAAVLPAGDYSFSVDSLEASTRLYIFRESGPAVGYMITAQARDTMPLSSEKDHLVLEQKDGVVCVTELQLGSEGLVLRFATPKYKR